MLLYPIFNYDVKSFVDKAYGNFFSKDDLFTKELKKMNNIKINDHTDYFLAHVIFDIE